MLRIGQGSEGRHGESPWRGIDVSFLVFVAVFDVVALIPVYALVLEMNGNDVVA